MAVHAGDKTLLTLAGDKLGYWTRVYGTPTPTTKLGPAQGGAVWLDVALDTSAPLPTDLVHTVSFTVPKPTPPLINAVMDEKVAPVVVLSRKPVVVAPPLDGPGWLDGGGCCDMSAHRNALNPLSGGLWAAERYAIDYLQLQPDGVLFTGDPTKLESYSYFGTDIHAVAEGPVVAVLDGLPEQFPPDADRTASRAVRRQPHRAGHRRRQLCVLRAPQNRQPEGRGRRPAHHRAGHCGAG